ncbi:MULTISPECIES: DUF2147 domain-containing protein [Acinetobacter]|uniref:DUF2147 domain-containing protein n=1 Tax=Acinetobacter TaxID=469 RepID=UPI00201B4FA1|nr:MULTISPECIES: DUF2147 domain-containing protein [Acinetobacter]MCL6237646.1 DUF2147 domain-containing protein [Acinetobacter amyesii]
MIGSEIIKEFKPDPQYPNQYSNGNVLDPLSGNIYKGKGKLSANGKRLTMRGYIGVSALGRSTTWIRND